MAAQTRLEYYLQLGRDSGVEAAKLLAFAKSSLATEQEEIKAAFEHSRLVAEEKDRQCKIDLENQEKRLKLAADEKRIAADEAESKMKLALEEAEHKVRLEASEDERRQKLAWELNSAKIESEKMSLLQVEENRRLTQIKLQEFELQKLQAENELKLNLAQLEMSKAVSIEQLKVSAEKELLVEKLKIAESETSINSKADTMFRPLNLGLPMFNNEAAEFDGFLARFKTIVTSYNIPRELYAVEFSKLLSGPSLEVYNLLPCEKQLDFDEVVNALKSRFKISVHTYRSLFKKSKPLSNERLCDYAIRLRSYLDEWLNKSQLPKSYEGLAELITSSQFFLCLSKECQTFLKEQGSKLSFGEMIEKAQLYNEAHGIDNGLDGKRKEFKSKSNQHFVRKDQRDTNIKQQKSADYVECKTNAETKSTVKLDFPKKSKPEIVCFSCGQKGHKSFNCGNKTKSENKSDNRHTAALCQINICGDETDLFPTIAVASHVSDDEFLVDLKSPFRGKAKVNNRPVTYLRDTGSSLCLVKSDLCNPDQFTGRNVAVLMADRVVKYFPEVKIDINSPCFVGEATALALENPIEKLVLGNNLFQTSCKEFKESAEEEIIDDCGKMPSKPVIFENSIVDCGNNRVYPVKDIVKVAETTIASVPAVINAVNSTDTMIVSKGDAIGETANAVMTRSKAIKEAKAPKPLKFSAVEALNISRNDFVKLQRDDSTLAKYYVLARDQKVEDGKPFFTVENDVLFRVYCSPTKEQYKQLMVPESLRERTTLFAHESILSGHMGITSTYRKLMKEFYFPGMHDYCRRLVGSCKLCQQGANRSVNGKAPTGSLPVIKEAFHSVYIDLVGKFPVASSEGHTHLLTILDAATTYLIAVPLKKTDSITIAEALMHVFNQYGYAKYVYCDNGSNLTSEVMDEVYRTLNIERRSSPVYHPQACKVERFHGVIKQILRKLVVDQPKEWHRFIDPLCFAIRTTPSSSGFSAFELLFGRDARTHLTFLRELWSGQDKEQDGKVVYQYVLDLQNKIAQTCDFAQKELAKIRNRNHNRLNKNARLRTFKTGQKVWVLNTRNEGKFDFNWVGPAEILERRGQVTYLVKFSNNNERVYHINMLKPFIDRDMIEKGNGKRQQSTNDSSKTACDDDDDNDNLDDLGITASTTAMGFIEVSDDDHDDDDGDDKGKIDLKQNLSDLPVPSSTATETWKDVIVNPDLNNSEKERIWKLLEKYKEVFSDVPSQTNLITCKIQVKSDEPIRHKAYPVPIHLRPAIEKELSKMVENDWIEPAGEDVNYASPLVVVRKKGSQDLRLCVSYKSLNEVTISDPTPVSDIESILGNIGKSRIFSTTDAAKGFYAIKIEPESRKYTGFVYQNAHYVHKVLAFGLLNAPALYAKMMQRLLYKAKNLDNFVDDIIAYNDDLDSHLITLEDLFRRTRDANLKLKPSKTRIGFAEIAYLGQVISNGEVRPTDENIERIVNAPIPKTKKGVRSLCGAVGWLRKYIPSAAKLLKPLNSLLVQSKGDVIKWGSEQETAWEEIKRILTTKPVLSLYDHTRDHKLCTDASDNCIAGVLMQLEPDGEWHPVFYASRRCNKAECNYDIQNKEALAVVWSCSKYYRFLYAKRFSVQVDSAALSILNGKFSNNARVRRWQLFLQSFEYDLEVVKSEENQIADFLSRLGT